MLANSAWDRRDPALPWLLAPCDLQAIKASGVTFATSLLERVIEEQARGDASKAEAIRTTITELIGTDLSQIEPGSQAAMRLKAHLIVQGAWSQYLEVGIGADAEIFTKCPPMASVGTGSAANANEGLLPGEMNLVYNASTIPSALMFAAQNEQDMLCRIFGDCLAGDELDREIGDLIGETSRGPVRDKLFTYLRYSADIGRRGLAVEVRSAPRDLRFDTGVPLVSAGDPLNLAGILTPGERVAARRRSCRMRAGSCVFGPRSDINRPQFLRTESPMINPPVGATSKCGPRWRAVEVRSRGNMNNPRQNAAGGLFQHAVNPKPTISMALIRTAHSAKRMARKESSWTRLHCR